MNSNTEELQIEADNINTYELLVFHRDTSIDKVWVEITGTSKEDALKNFKDGNFEWLDSKQIDSIDGEFIDEDEWKFIDS